MALLTHLGRLYRFLPPNRRRASGRLTRPALAWRAALPPALLLAAALAALPAAAPRILALVGRGLGVEIVTAQAEISYLRGTVVLHDVSVEKSFAPGAAPDTILAAPLVTGRFAVGALLRGDVHAFEVTLTRPRLHLEIGADGRSTIDRIVAEAPWLRGPRKAGGGGNAQLDEINADGAIVEFQDLTTDPSLLLQAQVDLRLAVEKGAGATFRVHGAIDDLARAFDVAARIQAAPDGTVDVRGYARGEGLSLLFLNSYLPPSVHAELEDGAVEVALDARLGPAAAGGVAAEADVRRLRVEDRGRALASIAGLSLRAPRLDPAGGAIIVEKAVAAELEGAVLRDEAGTLHVAGLALALDALPRPHRPALPTIAIEEVLLDGAALAWRDRAVRPPVETVIRVPRFHVSHVRFPEVAEASRFEAQLSADGLLRGLAVEGRVDPFGERRSLALKARVDGLALERLAPYFAGGAAPVMHDGRLEIAAEATLRDLGPARFAIEASVTGTALYEGPAVLAAIGALRVKAPLVDLAARRIEVESFEVEDPAARVRRRADGRLEALGFLGETRILWPRPPTATGSAPPVPRTMREPEIRPPWAIAVGHARARGAWLEVRDEVPETPFAAVLDVKDATLDGLVLPETPTAAAFAIELGVANVLDRLALEGTVKPLGRERALTIGLRVDGFRPEPLEPYRPKDFPIYVRDARATADAVVRLEELSPGVFRGEASLTRLAAHDRGALLASLDELHVKARRLAPAERSFDFESVEIFGPEARATRLEDGRIQIFGWTSRKRIDAFRRGAAPEVGPAEPIATAAATRAGRAGPPPLVTIEELRVSDGRAELRDLAVKPPARFDLEELEASARGLTTAGLRGAPAARSAFGVRFAIADVLSSFRADGAVKIAPVPEGAISARVRGIKLPPLSQYAYAVKEVAFLSGTAWVSSDIALSAARFESQNRLVARDLKLGGDGAKALVLTGSSPISLDAAVTLLRDDRGVIDLRVPVSGERGQASVAVPGIVAEAIVEAMSSSLKKIVSPITRLFRRPENENTYRFPVVPFAAGLATISAEGARALDETARMLKQKEDAVVELRGGADPAADAPAGLYFRATADASELESPPALAALRARRKALGEVAPEVDVVFIEGGKTRLSGRLVAAAKGRVALESKVLKAPCEIDVKEVALLFLGTAQGRAVAESVPELKALLERQKAALDALDKDLAAVEAEVARARKLSRAEVDEEARAARREIRTRLRALAAERARTARGYLVTRGVAPGRLRTGDPIERAIALPAPDAPSGAVVEIELALTAGD